MLVSYDLGLAALIALVLAWYLPPEISNAFVKDLYAVGISVLSIIFSVFFAALAIIISAGDNEFLEFLQEENHYTDLLKFFRFTLGLLFVALVFSVALYGVTSSAIDAKILTQSKWWFILFCLLFSYALFAAYGSTLDALKYANRRVHFISRKKGN